MSWTPRQRAMLAEMGTPLWFAPEVGVTAEPTASELNPPKKELEATASAVAESSQTQRAATSRLPGVATMGWPALRAAVADCRACPLGESRTQTVFGVGHLDAHWMIVGEAPGEQEDRLGEPFVGRSGQLLDNMLRALGLSRAAEGDLAEPSKQVYIANTLKCRPPGNRNPTPQELCECEPYLVRQIELVRPKIILAMGRFAVQSLLRSDEPIGKLRGRVHRFQGVPLIVTYHPAYLLRNLEDKAKAWDDLCLARITHEGV